MKILLIHPPYRRSRQLLPTGMAYVASFLLRAGHTVKVLDADAFVFSDEELRKKLTEEEFDVLGLGCIVTAYNFALKVADLIKKTKPYVKVVVGGTLATYSYDILLKNSPVDFCVIGEGEVTMLDLLSAIEEKRDLKKVDGIAYKEGAVIVRTNPRALIENLDEIPYPARHLFYAKEIYSRSTVIDNIFNAGKFMAISGGRGCPYSCTFCSYDRRVRMRSAASLVEELKMLKKDYGIKNFIFEEDLFMVDKARVEDFCNRLIKEKLNLYWSAGGRVNVVNKDILALMKRAGCYTLGYGLESGSAEMLMRMKKNVTPEQNEYGIKVTREAGIIPGGSWIIGMPGETPETVRMSVGLYKRINRYRNMYNEFFFATPYPSTELYKEMQSRGRITDEHEYMKKISTTGDAFKFAINCTDAFTDEELVAAKNNADYEVMTDFYKKHPFLKFGHLLRIGFIKKAIIFFKLNGLKSSLAKIIHKITK